MGKQELEHFRERLTGLEVALGWLLASLLLFAVLIVAPAMGLLH